MAAAFLGVLLAGGCGTGSESVTVFAAASLTESFEEIALAYEERHPGTRVELNFAASSRLAGQITSGAPADVFASANLAQMDLVVGAGLAAGPPRTFATNILAIAVEPGNPLNIRGLADLARPELLVVLAAPEVPVGRYAGEALEAAAVEVRPVSLEATVKAVVTKVALGEADAGIVYRTDVLAADGAVEGVEIPDEDNVAAMYPIVALAGAADPDSAEAFVEFVVSPAGQAILARHGFTAP